MNTQYPHTAEELFRAINSALELNTEIKTFLSQIDLDEKKPILELIKIQLLKHKETDPNEWKDPGYHYGHIGIKRTDENKQFTQKTFLIPVVAIEITVGRIITMPCGEGMRIVWSKKFP